MESVTLQRSMHESPEDLGTVYHVKDTELIVLPVADGWVVCPGLLSGSYTKEWLTDEGMNRTAFPTLQAVRWTLADTDSEPPAADTHHYTSVTVEDVVYKLLFSNNRYYVSKHRHGWAEALYINPVDDDYEAVFNRKGSWYQLGSHSTLRQCVQTYHEYELPRSVQFKEWFATKINRQRR